MYFLLKPSQATLLIFSFCSKNKIKNFPSPPIAIIIMETKNFSSSSLSTSSYRSTAVLHFSSSNTCSETLEESPSSWRSPLSNPFSHSECYNYLKSLGFSWEDEEEGRSYWSISTIWEPSVLKEVSIFQEMKVGEETTQINLASLNHSVLKGFKVFNKKLPSFVSSASHYIAVK
jgi:hypothetical protein